MTRKLVLTYTKIIPQVVGAKSRNFLVATMVNTFERESPNTHWGGLAHAISKRYPRCSFVGISISKEQIKYANKRYGSAQCKFIVCDYRDVLAQPTQYERIVSVGMFEHVGVRNYDGFFQYCANQLTKDGILVLHTITCPSQARYLTGVERYTTDEWLDRYIFPGGYVPTTESVLAAVD